MKLKNIKSNFLYSIIFLLIFFIFPSFVEAGSPAINGLNETMKEGMLGGAELNPSSLEGAGVISSIPKAIGQIVGAGLAFLGIVFMLLIIYGGFIWMFARGNEQEVVRAKGIIESAAIGLVIVLSAYALTSYLGGALL